MYTYMILEELPAAVVPPPPALGGTLPFMGVG